jgi:tyrosine-protein kinase Etk/Wzc
MTVNENDQPDSLLPMESSGGVDLLAVLTAILRAKRLILLVGALFAVAAFLYLRGIPNTYRATVSLLPPQITRGNTAASLLGQSGLANDISPLGAISSSIQAKSEADVFALIMNAWPIRDALVKRFNLVRPGKGMNAARARDLLASRVRIEATRQGMINVGVVDNDPQRAADMANAWVDETRVFLRGLSLSEASQRRAFYEVQLAKTRDDLSNAEVAFKQMQQKSGMVALDTQARTLIESAASLRSQITAKEVELESESGYLTESNPQRQIAESELTALRGQLSQLESSGQGGYSGKALSSVPGSELEFVRASRELKYQESLYELMQRQYAGSRIDEARDAPVIQVIEPALPPDHKFGPRRGRDTLLAFAAGIILGTLFVVVRYWLAGLDSAASQRLIGVRRDLLRW